MNENILQRPGFIRNQLIIIYAIGALGLILPWTRGLFQMLTPLNLLLSTAVLLWSRKNPGIWVITGWIIVAIAGFAIEAAGVATGEVFGQYWYGPVLGWSFLGVPLLIGVNWWMLSYAAFEILRNTGLAFPLRWIAGAAMLVVYDIILEPAAIFLNMWNWSGGTPPLQNYVAWGVLGFAFQIVLWATEKIPRKSLESASTGPQYRSLTVPFWLFAVQMGFFLIIDLFIFLGT